MRWLLLEQQRWQRRWGRQQQQCSGAEARGVHKLTATWKA